MNKRSPYPTDAELEILQVLWAAGKEPLTVRQVWERMGQKGGYTTVLKTLQIMLEKGHVLRDESKQTHTYLAAMEEGENQERMIGGLMERVFGGSLSQLVMRALSASKASPEELDAVQQLLKQARIDEQRREKAQQTQGSASSSPSLPRQARDEKGGV